MASDITGRFDAEYQSLFRELTRLGWALGLGRDAEDVAQDVLIDARRHLYQLRDPTKLRSWLRRMVSRSASRRRRKAKADGLDPTLTYLPADPSTALDLADAVRRLPPRGRLAVTLVYGLGYTEAEAAQVMEISRGGVAKALFDARTHLANSLADKDDS